MGFIPQRWRSFLALSFFLGVTVGVATTSVGAAMLGSAIFTDVPPGSFYDQALGDMYAAGVLKGKGPTTFDPNANVTRAELAVVAQRLFNISKGLPLDATPPPPAPPPPPPPADTSPESSASSVASSARSRSSRSSKSSSSSSSSAPANPDGGIIQFDVANTTLPESAAKATMTIGRTGILDKAVSVKWTTADDTATQDDYYNNGGTVQFLAGEKSKTITVLLKNDEVGEAAERLKIVLSEPTSGAALGATSTMYLNILDNDGGAGATGTSNSSVSASNAAAGSFQFAAAKYAVAENTSTVTIAVQRVNGSTGAASVSYATSNGSAESGKDYGAATGKLDFAAGETSKTFTVSITDNNSIEGARTVNLSLSSPTGGAGILESKSLLRIDDNDAGSTPAEATVNLDATKFRGIRNSSVKIPVNRSGNTGISISVKYTTSDATAVSGTDYTVTTGTLTFAAGEVQKIITVPILDKAKAEREFNFTISDPSPSGTLLGSDMTSKITIDN